MKYLTLVFPGLAAALFLSGCGVRGDLERPPPFWGPDLRTAEERAYETENEDLADETVTEATEETPES